MSANVLVLYEIADKAAGVKTRKGYNEFEKWIKTILQTYQDAAIERVAKMHLFRLRTEFML